MPIFTPPTTLEKAGDALFGRMHSAMQVGLSVVKENGVYKTTPYPWLGDLIGLTEGADWFQGGRTYDVDDATAAALEAAGYTVDRTAGYGIGGYGSLGFGE